MTAQTCPECGARLKPIVYGLIPDTEGLGDVILGGCSIFGDNPLFGCDCGYQLPRSPEEIARNNLQHLLGEVHGSMEANVLEALNQRAVSRAELRSEQLRAIRELSKAIPNRALLECYSMQELIKLRGEVMQLISFRLEASSCSSEALVFALILLEFLDLGTYVQLPLRGIGPGSMSPDIIEPLLRELEGRKAGLSAAGFDMRFDIHDLDFMEIHLRAERMRISFENFQKNYREAGDVANNNDPFDEWGSDTTLECALAIQFFVDNDVQTRPEILEASKYMYGVVSNAIDKAAEAWRANGGMPL